MASYFYVLICLIMSQPLQAKESEKVFRFTLLAEPTTLDPQMLSSASGNYITTLLYRGLYRWDASSQLLPDEGSCHWISSLKLTCQISKNAKWSDGSSVNAKDYVRGFRFLIDPKNATPQAALLFKIKNARAIHEGQTPPDQLGIRSIGKDKFQISFEQPDSEFLYKFVHPALYPRHKSFKKGFRAHDKLVSNGAFSLSEVKSGESFLLKRNPSHPKSDDKNAVQSLEALIVESDTTALQLFEAGTIQFLRRVPAEEFPRYKTKESFHQFPVLRFDYVGFGPELHPFPQTRKALAQAFDPTSFQKIFETEGSPGCPSIPSSFYIGSQCFKRKSKIPEFQWPPNLPQVFGFSQMGGEDIKRAAEWFQSQWKSNLGIEVELQSREQKVYLNWLRSKPPALFRKGLSLDRPTCLAALENFRKGHPENYIQFENEKFEKILKELSSTRSERKTKRLCSQGLKLLIQEAYIIPLGEMKFSILVNPRFTGWKINSLNQLDLSGLKISK